MNKKVVAVTLFCLAAVTVGSGEVSKAVAVEMQPPIFLNAAEVLPGDLLRGSNYTVEQKIINDGLINTYTLTTDYGPVTVESTGRLLMRINELKALAVMEDVDRKGIFGEAVVKGVKAPVQTVVELVQEPVETGKNIVAGAGRFFSNIGNAIVSEDPSQDNALKVALGYDVAKRQFAFAFGIDPYTTYEPVVDRLGAIARAAVAGGLTPKAVLAAADSDLATGLRISGTAKGLKELVRDKSPAELHKLNMQKMQAMGVPAELTDVFLNNYSYNPQEKTLLVGALETMQGVQGREVFFALAARATDQKVAVYYRLIGQMMAGYHAGIAPVARVVDIDGTPHLMTEGGVIVLVTPVDYVFWTTRVAEKVERIDGKTAGMRAAGGKEVWITGRMDAATRANLEQRGWKVVEDSGKKLLL